MIDTICTCNHWYEEHETGGGACGAPRCGCPAFNYDREASTPEAIADRGGDPQQWPQRVKDHFARLGDAAAPALPAAMDGGTTVLARPSTPEEIDPRALTMPERRDLVIAAAAALIGPVPFLRSAGTDEAVVSASAVAQLRTALDGLNAPSGGLACPICGKAATNYYEANVERRRVVHIEPDGHVTVGSDTAGTDDYRDPEWACEDGHSWPTGDEEITFGE